MGGNLVRRARVVALPDKRCWKGKSSLATPSPGVSFVYDADLTCRDRVYEKKKGDRLDSVNMLEIEKRFGA